MRKRRLLLATSALTTVMACRHDKPVVYANPKGSHYAIDAGAGSAASDGGAPAADGGAPDTTENKPPAG